MVFASIVSNTAHVSGVSSVAIAQVFSDYVPVIISAELMLLIILYEILFTTKVWEKSLETSLKIGIFPLVYSLFVISILRVMDYL